MSRSFTMMKVISGLFCLVLLLSSCMSPLEIAGQNTPAPLPSITPTPFLTATPQPTYPIPAKFRQSPQVESMVQAHVLPAVADRLPEHPKVVRPVENVGRYGGTWRMVIQPAADGAQFIRTVAYEPLVRWTSDWSGVEPNIAESYSINANATEYTFTLRRGMHWSDGEPFTTADIRFWYEKILLNTSLTPIIPAWLKVQNQVAKFEFVDEITFKVKFANSNFLFLEQLAAPDALVITSFPAHYVKKFHPDFLAPTELESLLMQGKYASWQDMFIKRVGVKSLDIGNFVDPNRPRLTAWVLDEPYNIKTATVSWHRNPFYWKVDTAGNQLPYIESVFFQMADNIDDAINRTMAGDVDMQNLSEMGMDIVSVYKNLNTAEYDLFRLTDASNNVLVINLNLTDNNMAKRAIFRNKEFRIGLSYAIDRKEIINVIYNGKGRPWQVAPLESSPFYDAGMATQYTEYNVEKANEYLDKAGFKKDQMGKRLGSDGIPISFAIDVLETDARQIAIINLVAKYWAAVGVDVQPNPLPLPIFVATINANMHDAAAYQGGATFLSDVMINPSNFLPYGQDAFWAIPWAYWFNGVNLYEDQPPDTTARTGMTIYDRVRGVKKIDERIRIMKGALTLARESFWTIGIASGTEEYGLIRKNFHNVPQYMPSAWMYPDPAPTNPEQYFFQ